MIKTRKNGYAGDVSKSSGMRVFSATAGSGAGVQNEE